MGRWSAQSSRSRSKPARVHLVVEKLDPAGVLPLGREHVQNVAPQGHLAGAFQHVHPLVAGSHQIRKELPGRQHVPPLHHLHLGDERFGRGQPLHERPGAGDDEGGHAQHQPGEDPQPLAPALRGRRLHVDQRELPGQKGQGVGPVNLDFVEELDGRRLGVQDHQTGPVLPQGREHGRPGSVGQGKDRRGAPSLLESRQQLRHRRVPLQL